MENDLSTRAEGGATRLEGTVLGQRYRVENVVSSGANTVIVEAIDTETNQPVTVKIVRPELAESAEFKRAFRRQAEIAMALSHPNVASVLGWGDTELDGETTVFWVVEYLGGGSLRDLFDRGRLLEPSQALVIGLEACRALDAAHQRGIVHTELTPSKLVFGEDRRLRVVDFAMAQLLGVEAWGDAATVATHVARYASPEQALGVPVDEKTDVYALSLCLIEAVTGNVPFAGDSTVSTLAGRIGKLMLVSADLGALASVLERAGRPEAEDRWTAAEFGRALVQAAETLPRPEPIPIMAASTFAVSQMRRPTDPTGGMARPQDTADESEPVVDDEPVADDDAAVDAELIADDEAVDAEGSDDVGDRDGDDALDSEDDAATDDDAIDVGDIAAVAGAAAVTAAVVGDSTDAEPLLLMTDIADPPTGAVQVAGDDGSDTADVADEDGSDVADDDGSEVAGDDGAEAIGPTPGGDLSPQPTMEMPVPMGAPVLAADIDPTPSGIVYDEEDSGKPWGKIALLTLVALVGISALSYAGWLLLRTKSYEVPDLVGVEQTVALNEVSGNDWVIETDRERSDEVPEIDFVVRTNPAAGEVLDEGEVFVMYVSDGPELRTLPELAGMTLEDALSTLDDLRLIGVEDPSEFSETVPEGSVISWQVQDDASLTAGAQVLPETTIGLTVSKGPEPRSAPELVGLTLDEATASVESLQLVIAQGDPVFSNQIEKDLVVTQSPDHSTAVERGGTVSVQLSKGPDLIAIPSLEGLTFIEAETLLLDTGFVIDSLLGTTEGTFVSISVDGQEVQAGDQFRRGTGVDLIFL